MDGISHLIIIDTDHQPPPDRSEIHAAPLNCNAIFIFGDKFNVDVCSPALVSWDTLKSVHGTRALSGQLNEPH